MATKKKAKTKKTATKQSATKRPAAKPAPRSKARPLAKAKPALAPRRDGERRHWIVKSEPSTYSWTRMLTDGRATWDGIRSYEARNNLRAMRLDDLAFFYHSSDGKEIVGVVRVVGEAREDATAPGEDWSAVDLAPVRALNTPVTLATMKATPALSSLELIAKSRLSVTHVSNEEFRQILALAETSLDGE
ncbi:MAG: EVE domain-containing protein [Polyangiales bacterium]